MLRLWDTRSGRPGPVLEGHTGMVFGCAFSPDGALLASAGADRARGAELVCEVESYEDIYRLCDVRRPEGIIVELAEQIG
jgi:WD40 repeat protein